MSLDSTLQKDELASILGRITNLLQRQESVVEAADVDETDDDIPVLTEIYIGTSLAAEPVANGSGVTSGLHVSPHDEPILGTNRLEDSNFKDSSSNNSQLGLRNAYPAERSNFGEQSFTQQPPLSQELVARFLAEMQPLILQAVKIAVLEESVKAEQVLTQKLEQEILLLLRNRLTTGVA